jgi:hypothetical protein
VPHLLHVLLVPVLLLVNAALVGGLVTMLAGIAVSPVIRSSLLGPWSVVGWYWLTFALALFLTASVYARREPGLPRRRLLLLGHAFAFYSLLWIAAGYWALGRILRGSRGWHKTERLAEQPAQLAAQTEAVARDAT